MDDLIVIILTLVIVVVGLLGQLKKKKEVAAGAGQPGQPKSFWDLLEDETDLPVQEESPEYDEERKPEPVVSAETPFYRIKTKNEEPFVMDDDLTKKSTRIKFKSKTIKGFSLRKAVIYSEILNRKYT